MKTRAIFVIFFSLCSIFSFGQLQRGMWLVEGNAGWNKELNNNYKYASYEISPSFGYALSSKWMLGTGLSYFYSNYNNEAENSNFQSNNYTFSPFIRYYFSKPEKLVKIFTALEGNIYLQEGKSTTRFGSVDVTSTDYAARAMVGADYFITSSIALEGTLRYLIDFQESSTANHYIGYRLSLQFFLQNQTESHLSNGIALTKGAYYIAYNPFTVSASWNYNGPFHDYNIQFNPTIGYFLTDRWALGTGFLLGFAKQNSIVDIAPFVRYYFGTQNARFQPFATASVSTRFQLADNTFESSFFNLDANAGIGVDFFLTRNVALEGLLQFNGNQVEDKTFNRNFLNVSFGFQFFLNE